MRYALISDIHGNTEALRSVFEDIENQRVDKVLCLGDIVGYGAEPVECLREIRSRRIEAALGNHDSAAIGDTPMDYFNEYAREAILWTAKRLREIDRKYLASLPLTRDYEMFSVVHASLENPHGWGYVMDSLSARNCFSLLDRRVCFIGHSHVPLVFTEKGAIGYSREREVDLRKGTRYIINIGSVGQPRDGDPRAGYCVCDTAEMRAEIRRVPYDIKTVQTKIIEAGLPRFLAARLQMGR